MLIWDNRVFEKLDVIARQFFVSVVLRGVVVTLFGLVQACMALMMMDSGLLCGKSCLRCVLDGPWHGA